MTLAIFALRQSAQPTRLEVPTPQRSDRFALMQPEPSHPASSPMTSGQDKIAPPQLTTSRARNGRSRLTLRWSKRDSKSRSHRERIGRGETPAAITGSREDLSLISGLSWSFRDLPSATPDGPFCKSGTEGSNPLCSSNE